MYPFTTLSHPTSDIRHPTLLLHTAQGTRYLFGKVPEGLQRSLNEQKTRVSKVSAVFLTGELDWESIGGLPGLILTISDQGKKDLNVYYGSTFLEYVVATWRSFVFRFGMDLGAKVIPNGETFTDKIMSIQSVVLKKTKQVPDQSFSESVSQKLGSIVTKMFPLEVKNVYSNEDNESFESQSDPKLTNSYIHVKLPKPTTIQTSTCYSIQLNSLRGKFLAQKAAELGVPNGKLRGQLAGGKEVTLPDGTIVRPEQVLSEERHFQKVLIIDIPSHDYFQSAKEVEWGNNVGIIYHFLGESVKPFEEEYLEFIQSFGPNTTHHISHPLYCPDSIVFKSYSELILKLKALHCNHFNLPISSSAKEFKPEGLSEKVLILEQGQTTTIECAPIAKNNIIKVEQPNIALSMGDHWEESYNKMINDLTPLYTKEEIFNKSTVSALKVNPSVPLKDQVETITLGTGSALPSKYRNVVSTLVRVPYRTKDDKFSFRSVLLDAGENTIGSIKRSLGAGNLPMYFKELKLIYLSHLHADHHLGIITIIKEWFHVNSDNDEKLYLITPWQYNRFVEEWLNSEFQDILDRLVYISCEDFLVGRVRNEIKCIEFDSFDPSTENLMEIAEYQKNYGAISNLYKELGIKKILTCRAIHCDWAYCCSIIFKLEDSERTDSNTFKVSYSGDTRPNYFLFAEKIGQASDLLIHEATLENDLVVEAKKKKHSTMNEAISVSNKMNTKKLILTHFSQRYPHLPDISDHVKVEADYCIAFDLMINKYSDIGDQLKIMEQLNSIFAPEKFANDDIEE